MRTSQVECRSQAAGPQQALCAGRHEGDVMFIVTVAAVVKRCGGRPSRKDSSAKYRVGENTEGWLELGLILFKGTSGN